MSAPGATPGTGISVAQTIGTLPRPRSDSAAVTVGATTYIVGGYDGANPDSAVLATTDGRTFSTVASLPVPVRYPAVAASGGLVYVFGGEAISGPGAGQPVNVIQAVDPKRHRASIVGQLPIPLAAAAAVTIAGQVYLAGGESTVAQSVVPGVGTTQIGPPPPGSDPGAGATSATNTAATFPAGAKAKGLVLTDTSSPSGSAISGATTPDAGPSEARVNESTTGTSTVSTIWAFNPTTGKMLSAGRLQVPVSHSSVAVMGTTAWFVGGESNGTPVAAVQMLRPNLKFGLAGAPGAGSPYFGLQLPIADRGQQPTHGVGLGHAHHLDLSIGHITG